MICTPSLAPPPPSGPSMSPATLSPIPRAMSPTKAITTRVTGPGATANATRAQEVSLDHIKVPLVRLDTDAITRTLASTLAMSLLGHVLFLKSQVPFPIAQLARMPGTQLQPNSRAAKRRGELISAIDILSSHLHTTFAALSTAFARNKSRRKDVERAEDLASAHLVFALGPSVGAARARVVYVVDGLEVKVWGDRDDTSDVSSGSSTEDTSEGNTSDSDEDSEDVEDDETDETSEQDDEEGFHDVDSESGTEPPSSRSPSPSTPSSSRSISPSEVPELPVRSPLGPALPSPSDARRSSSPTLHLSAPTYAEEQQSLRAAERLLSRTLANACAEEGGGISCELAPTQTHVLLRAPRRFAHPAWIPRQNLTRTLDGVLDAFMADSACPCERTANKTKASRTGVRTEGVWIACRGSKGGADWGSTAPDEENGDESGDEGVDGKDGEDSEEDEMIWWVWDGKIVGFSDW
ncbi:hypothetical protein OBBRIDRAFT_725243 [Obba rivulosa]|uniref:Uncharacterized protein n=1 Tax=Obba rivulosa TaxID=1052685 RepID=A0A8E2DPA3_9APHY|nr:hypothetical protein OBBRIDRAFT_725243 [Obba rivulosa]